MENAKSTVVYVNPASGNGRGQRVWKKLLQAEPALAKTRLVLETSTATAEAALDTALTEGTQRVIAVGGDGTAQLVARHLRTRGLGQNCPFGLVPAGTGSDLARGLHLPKNPLDALHHLEKCSPRPLDLLQLRRDSGEEGLSINVASMGVSGTVAARVNAKANRGQLPYLSATVRALLSHDPTPCRVLVDGEVVHEGGFFVLAVANGPIFGKGMRVAPGAKHGDGLAEVVLVPPLPLWQLPFRLPQFLAGRHPRWRGVLCRPARHVRIEPLAPMPPFELDGETLPSGAAEIRLLPGALRILA